MRSLPQRGPQSVALSIVVHAAAALVLSIAPLEARRFLAPPIEMEVSMTFAPPDPEPLDAVLPPPIEVGTVARTGRPRPSPLAPAETAVPPTVGTIDGIVPADEAPLAPLATAEGGEERTERDEARIRWAIDTDRVAREMVLEEDPGPTTRGEPATAELDPSVPLLSEEEAEALHSEHLRAQAMLRDWLSETPIEPHERPDGSWVWEGSLFTATIDREGRIHYDDHPAASVDFATGSVTYSLEDLIMGAAGFDPYQAERQRFEEETEDLVLRLEAAEHVRTTERAVRIFRGSLVAIWNDDDRPAVSRRRAIFHEWDGTDEDEELGRLCRAAVLEFVREQIPFGSDDAYTEAELAGLNALRDSREAFDPY